MLDMRYYYIFSHVLGIDLDDNNIIDMKYLYYMMNINFLCKEHWEFYHFKCYVI